MARGRKKTTPGGGYAGQPNRTAPSSQYGKAAESARAQAVVPLPDVAATQAGLAEGLGDLSALRPGAVPLDAPTGRPWEPVTEGADFGPGRGLDELQTPVIPQTPPVDPRLFAVYLPQLEAIASEETSSHNLRSLVRRLRAQMPLDFDPTGEG